MKDLRDLAVIGLQRAGGAVPSPGDDLVGRLPPTSAETALLLRLGVAAVRARAGRKPGHAQLGEPAARETRPVCSGPLAAIVVELCRDRAMELLAEALTRIDERGLRLPSWCLVPLAELEHPGLQPAAGRVSGERGRWLAARRPRWQWLAASDRGQSIGARQKVWEEGPLPARLEALHATRREDPATGRAWVDSVWKQEKASVREQLLGAFEEGLGAEDEAFLARAASDRTAPVRTAAARLLARLPGSELALRMRKSADDLLDVRSGKLEVTPPAAFDPEWTRSGLIEKPPPGVGEKAHWLAQVLSLVPPGHWSDRFGAAPEVLVAAARKSDWSATLLGGWLAATTLFRAAPWASALWRGHAADAGIEELPALASQLLPLLAREEREALVRPRLGSSDPATLLPMLAALPAPWGHDFDDAFLDAVDRAQEATSLTWQQVHGWKACLDRAGTRLPRACFDRALALAARPGLAEDADNPLRRSLESFHAILTMRRRIHEETCP
jgi:hypothetical protein